MEANKSSIGSVIATIIIIAIIILGGLYFWGKRIEESKIKKDLITDFTTETTDNSANAIYGLSSGDDLNSIETDLNGTNLDNLGTELQ
jgi:hypothetical protein